MTGKQRRQKNGCNKEIEIYYNDIMVLKKTPTALTSITL